MSLNYLIPLARADLSPSKPSLFLHKGSVTLCLWRGVHRPVRTGCTLTQCLSPLTQMDIYLLSGSDSRSSTSWFLFDSQLSHCSASIWTRWPHKCWSKSFLWGSSWTKQWSIQAPLLSGWLNSGNCAHFSSHTILYSFFIRLKLPTRIPRQVLDKLLLHKHTCKGIMISFLWCCCKFGIASISKSI